MAKKLLFGKEGQEPLRSGIAQLERAVRSTLGPMGKNVMIERGTGDILITKDGVTVAKETVLPDFIEDLGAQLIKKVANDTVRLVGDGTTTATILANSMIQYGMESIEQNMSVHDVKRGMDRACSDIVQELKNQSVPAKTFEDLEDIATISANGDRELGTVIAEAYDYVGANGSVLPQESHSMETVLIKTNGIVLDAGYISPYFQNNEKEEAVYNNPRILITDSEITEISQIAPILEAALSDGQSPIVIVCRNMEGEALTSLVRNKLEGGLPLAAMFMPHFQCKPLAGLNDIARALGGKVVSESEGKPLSDGFQLEHFGSCEKIIISSKETTIVKPKGNVKAAIDLIKVSDSTDTEKNYRENLISGKSATIQLGSRSNTEYKERLDRFDDSIHATKAAIQEGTVVGGGKAFHNAYVALKGKEIPGSNAYLLGYRIVLNSIIAPIYRLMLNCGVEYNKIDGLITFNYSKDRGIDYKNPQNFIDYRERGIIDPVKVPRVALESATSIAASILTTDVLITRMRQKRDWKDSNFDQ